MNKNGNIDCIFFDCFGVLVSELSPQWLGAHFSPEEAERISREVIRKADLGIISEDETYSQLAALCGKTPEQVKNEWKSIPQLNNEMINTVIELRKSYKTVLLSNAISGLVEHILGDELMNEMFDETVISSKIGMAKPDDDIFGYAVKISGCEASRCVFTDDNPNNIIAAERNGIKGIVFTSVENFTSTLELI